MGCLRPDRNLVAVVLCLGNRKAIELLAGELGLDRLRALPIPAQLHLRLHELGPARYVQYRCSCVQVVALHAMKVQELFLHAV